MDTQQSNEQKKDQNIESQEEDIIRSRELEEEVLKQRIPSKVVEIILKLQREKQYRITKIIGEGSSGLVFRASNKDKKDVAIKIINVEDRESLLVFQSEVSNLKQVDSPHVIKLLESFFDKVNNMFYSVTEYYPNNNLSDYLKNHQQPEEQIVLKIFRGILQGIEGLHNKNIIHSNLKPSKILVNQELEVKICGLGFSVQKENKDSSFVQNKGCTYGYCAPEQQMGQVGFQSDIFSAGKILTDLCFPGQQGKKVSNLDECEFPLLKNIIEDMTEEIQFQRITLQEIKERIQ